MIEITITNDKGEVLVLPMFVSRFGNPDFTEENGLRLTTHTNYEHAWHDVCYVCYDGGQTSHSFEADEEYNTKSFSYSITIYGKPCTKEELYEYCDTYNMEEPDFNTPMTSEEERELFTHVNTTSWSNK